MEKRYTFQNTARKWATITSIDELTYTTRKNMAEYRSQYYALKASIKEQNITIENKQKIWILNNFGLALKTYLTIINDCIQKEEKLKKDEVLYKAIEEEDTHIKAKLKASTNFSSTKLNTKSQEGAVKEKIEFVEWPKCEISGCKHPGDQEYKQVNEMCDNYDKKRHIFYFYNSYTFLNKGNSPQRSIASS